MSDAADRRVLIVCADLLTGGPLVQAVRNAGRTPVRALSAAKADAAGCEAMLVDLTLAGAADWLAALPADGPPVLAFCPHVRTDLIRAARGLDRGLVLVRSQLAEGVPSWLASLDA